jgi:CelD/BcsL family acetyltransferase involved in cellulose biosynthesis
MKIETIETFDEFLNLENEWNALLRAASADCVFLTHEWLSTWWKHLGENRRLHIITVRDGNRLVGILPLAIKSAQIARMMPRALEFLGSGVIGSDYLDAIIDRDCEREVAAAFADHLHQRGLMLQLSQVRAGSCIASAVLQDLQRRSWTVSETKLNVCPYIDLTGHTWESYLATIGPNVRKNINRYLRNLPKTFDMRVDCVRTPDEAQKALAIAMELHRKRWEAPGTSEAFHSGPIVAFHREFVQVAADRGWLRLLLLWLDGTPTAALYGLRYGPVFYFYQSGFDPAYSKHSVGVATMGLAIKTAIEEGAAEYDFLHGDEEYKFHWARGLRDLVRWEAHPPQMTAWIYKHAIDFNRAARQMAKRMLNLGSHAALNR